MGSDLSSILFCWPNVWMANRTDNRLLTGAFLGGFHVTSSVSRRSAEVADRVVVGMSAIENRRDFRRAFSLEGFPFGGFRDLFFWRVKLRLRLWGCLRVLSALGVFKGSFWLKFGFGTSGGNSNLHSKFWTEKYSLKSFEVAWSRLKSLEVPWSSLKSLEIAWSALFAWRSMLVVVGDG